MTWSQSVWRRFCQMMVKSFYRRFEAVGLEDLPAEGPLILCANHVNALVDALVIQAACPRPIHPVARSGLFRNPLLRPVLAFIQAVPIYRRPQVDPEAGPLKKIIETRRAAKGDKNEDSFRKLYELLAAGRVILIFPEGQSHSDPSLRPLKTGAARLALGHLERTGEVVPVVPIGLLFTDKGRFRAGALVQMGEPVRWTPRPAGDEPEEKQVKRYTEEIDEALKQVTLNIDSWEDKALMDLLQKYFRLRLTVRTDSGELEPLGDRPSLSRRFRSYQRILEAQRTLRLTEPEKVDDLRQNLKRFDRLCRRYGVRDHQLDLHYTPGVIARWMLRNILFLLIVVPLGLWGLIHSGIPYVLTRLASRLSAKARDHYDTAGMLWGNFFFLGFWGAQTAAVFLRWGLWPAFGYAVSLPFTAGIALKLGHERRRILDESRVFWLFLRRQDVRQFLRDKREELEAEVGRMARMSQEMDSEPHPATEATS